MAELLQGWKRSAYCAEVKPEDVGKEILLMGWSGTWRNLGSLIFIGLRDRTGVMQVVFNESFTPKDVFELGETIRSEYVIAVKGTLARRAPEMVNKDMATGEYELHATELKILSKAQTPPIYIDDNLNTQEQVRLKYRYLDLRRPSMQKILMTRHEMMQIIREYYSENGFLEIETPILCKSTPEGARDYLVPSRVHPGEFYALPQSPQLFKQLLMVGGLDRYYQVARCFRDEDLRADRQPEFTQLDMELSFVTQEDILVHLEKLFKSLVRSVMELDLKEPFPRLTWREAMDRYGSDKPDLRFAMPIVDMTDIAAKSGFSVFESVVKRGGFVRALNVKGGARFSKTGIELLTSRALGYGAKGMAWIMLREDGSVNSILQKFLTEEAWTAILGRAGMEKGDFLLFCADSLPVVRRALGGLRLEIADMLELRDKNKLAFLFVTDFSEFEYDEAEQRFVATHHPFTMPYEEDLPYLFSDPARVRAQAYDVVLNGVELGSGSVRIHSSEVQKLMFKALGFSDEEAERRFGFFVRAFRYGTPPHGGFAFGLDRLVMLLSGADSLRDVTAFPKTKDARCLLTNAPDTVDDAQLKELRLLTHRDGAPALAAPQKGGPAFDIARTAELSMLPLDASAQGALEKELSGILSFASQLSALDTAGVIPSAHAAPLTNVLREDVPETTASAPLLKNAPELHGGYFRVPAALNLLEKEDAL